MIYKFVNADDLGAALGRKRKSSKGDDKAVMRYKRAALELLGGVEWAYDDETEVLTIGSTTTAGVDYTVTFLDCNCKAGLTGKVCVHSAAYDLLASALWTGPKYTRPMQRTDDAAYESLLAEVDAWF